MCIRDSVVGAAALDVDELLADAHRDLARAAVGDGEVAVQALDRADRRDHRRGAAGERLADAARGSAVPPLRQADRAFLDAAAGPLGQLDHRVAGDAGQDRAGQRRGDQGAVVEDEEDVHPAELVDVLALHRVQVDHLVAAVLDGLGLRGEPGRVVAAALGRAGAAGGRPGVVGGDPDRDRLDAAGEVRPDRGRDDQVQVFQRRAHTEEDLAGVGERPQVEAAVLTLGDPLPVDRDDLVQRLEEDLLRQLRHRHPLSGLGEARGVRLRAEHRDTAVGQRVRLQTLEDLLRVVQHGAGRIHRDRRARLDAGLIPPLAVGVTHGDHVVREDPAESGVRQHRGTLGVRHGRLMRTDLEIEAVTTAHDKGTCFLRKISMRGAPVVRP